MEKRECLAKCIVGCEDSIDRVLLYCLYCSFSIYYDVWTSYKPFWLSRDCLSWG